METLTDDILLDVLRRLPPRSQAVSRCVCRAWRALISGDDMLRANLLPRSLAGLIIDYCSHQYLSQAMLFARPGVGSGDYAIPYGGRLQDHCNGLLLFCGGFVLNPATGRCATLPERVGTAQDDPVVLEYEFLAFDPEISSDYEVVMVPFVVPPEPRVFAEPAVLDSEWSPSPWILTVFSSATGLWEEKLFIRQGEPAGTVDDLRRNWWRDYWREDDDGRAEYWRGALYVQCKTDFVMRISLSDSTYRVIKPPRFFESQEFVIGRSKNGIYSAFLDDKCRLWIWILDESCHDQIEWKLVHDSGRGIAFPSLGFGSGPWILYDHRSGPWTLYDHRSQVQVDQEFEWNSDDDDDDDSNNTILPNHDTTKECDKFIKVMVFHPYKETVFFYISSRRVMVYHLSSSKLEDLGKLLPVTFFSGLGYKYIRNCIPYTPCWTGELPENFEQIEDRHVLHWIL